MNLKRKVYTFNKEEKNQKGEFIKQLGYIACSSSMQKVFHTWQSEGSDMEKRDGSWDCYVKL